MDCYGRSFEIRGIVRLDGHKGYSCIEKTRQTQDRFDYDDDDRQS